MYFSQLLSRPSEAVYLHLTKITVYHLLCCLQRYVNVPKICQSPVQRDTGVWSCH